MNGYGARSLGSVVVDEEMMRPAGVLGSVSVWSFLQCSDMVVGQEGHLTHKMVMPLIFKCSLSEHVK